MNRSEQPHQPSNAENASRNDDKGPAADPDSVNFVHCLRDHLTAIRHQSDFGAANNEVWDQFFREHAALLSRFVKAYRWPMEESQDGVQDLWLTLITRLTTFQLHPERGELEDQPTRPLAAAPRVGSRQSKEARTS
jgi:hypothetical protein